MIAPYRGRNLFKTSGRCAISAKKLGILLNFCVRASNVACAAGAALSFVSGLTAGMKPPWASVFLGWQRECTPDDNIAGGVIAFVQYFTGPDNHGHSRH